MQKKLLLIAVVLIGVMVAVPAILVSFDHDDPLDGKSPSDQDEDISLNAGPEIKVYLTKEKKVKKIPMERYIRGVVAAEMPADFHLEALKAQALAARTYIVDRLLRGDYEDMKARGGKATKAYVTDTVDHQVYLTDEQLKEKWGEDYETYSNRVNQAVKDTKGQVIHYKGKPIYAAFFSTSNGKTENSEDYFSTSYPYLRSVPSPWDKASPKYKDQKEFKLKEFTRRLTESTGKQISVPASAGNGWIKVTERTEGGQISKIQVGDQVFTGRQIREALDLSSADFEWSLSNGQITLVTKGYGHGVGMSQWGANLLANRGKKAKEIVRYYYQGVEVTQMNKKLARKEKG